MWRLFNFIVVMGFLLFLSNVNVHAQTPFPSTTNVPQLPVQGRIDITRVPNDLSIINALPSTSDTGVSAAKRTPASVRTRLTKNTFRATEKVSVTFTNPGNDRLAMTVTDAQSQEVSVLKESTTTNNITTLSLLPTKQLKPGKYTLKVQGIAGTMLVQDFTWGVLAINTNKSYYQPREQAHLEMAVLNNLGNMVCDARVTLRIQNAALGVDDILSTENGKIKINPECYTHDFTLVPDYEANYVVDDEGDYTMTLTAQTSNGTYTITDGFAVRADMPFTVERVTATRIYPPNTYPVIFKITANQDFAGTLKESVPETFGTTEISVYTDKIDRTTYENEIASPAATLSPTPEPSVGVSPIPTQAIGSDSANESSSSASGTLLVSPTQQAGHSTSVQGSQSVSLQLPFYGTYPITQRFGEDTTDPLLLREYKSFGLLGHDGMDFGLPQGTPVLAAESGTVIFAGPGDYGNTVVVQHSWGRTYYGHLSVIDVHIGTSLNKGEQLGLSGNTGLSTGPHLHFGVKFTDFDDNNGYYGKVDPMVYINNVVFTAVAGASDQQAPVPNMSKVSVISYPLQMKKGETMQLVYKYQAPKVSPELYMLGPMELVDSQGRTVFIEGRQWQIASDAVWLSSSWTYRKAITIDYTKVSTSSHTNFPVLINLASDTQLAANALDNNYDIVFTSSDGSTKLAADIESFDGATGALVAWVNIPSLSNTVNTVIYMYYGNPSSCNQQLSSCTSIDGTKNANTAWNSNYASVWHMKDTPNTTVYDATSNVMDLTSLGSMGSGQRVTGKIGYAIDFDGTDDRMYHTDSSVYDFGSDMTFSTWFYLDAALAGNFGLVTKQHASAPWYGFQIYLEDNASDTAAWNWVNTSGTPEYYGDTTGAPYTTGSWYYITYQKIGNSGKVFINGSDVTNITLSTTGTLLASDSYIVIGSLDFGGGNAFNGKLDEVRLSSSGRSTGWIVTEYNNQNSPSTFYTLGSQECMNPPEMGAVMRHGKYFNACGRQAFTW